MQLYALGINHQTATVDLRARVAMLPEQLDGALKHACKTCQIEDMVIVSTCNRTEIYAKTDTPETLLHWLADTHQVPASELTPHLYQYHDQDAIKHLIRVACGLDSMVLGEPQIFGQVKAALQYARQAESVSPNLVRIFEHVFYVAKRVRTETALGAQAVSMGFAVIKLAKQMFSHLHKTSALIVATGEMNILVAKHMVEQGVGHIVLCNRTMLTAQNLATALQSIVTINANACRIDVIDWLQLPDALRYADIVSTCTGSLSHVLSKQDVENAFAHRKHQPMLIVDLAVPRDVEASVADLEDVFLYTVDDLQHVIEGNIQQRREAANDAEVMVDACVQAFVKQHRARSAVPAIAAYRQSAERMRLIELDKALQQIAKGAAVAEVLERLTQSLTAKLIHAPSQLLRDAGSFEDDTVLQLTINSLGLSDDSLQ